MGTTAEDVQLSDFNTLYGSNGKVAVVTGGSRGLGLIAASGCGISNSPGSQRNTKLTHQHRFMLAACSKVLIVSRKATACEEAVKALNNLPHKAPHARAISLPADLARVSEIDRMVQVLLAYIDHVDILFANAGASWGAPVEKQPEEAFTKVLNLNVKSIFYTVQRLQPALRRRATIGNPSSVIINASAAGLAVGTLGENGTHGYSVCKAAAVHLAKILAVELGPRAINTNAICPGFFPTKMAKGLIALEGGLDSQAVRTPHHRLGRPEDLAGLVVFLASRAASHINDAIISLDGGAHLRGGKL